MKRCTSCMQEYPIESFSFQKKDPTKRYAYCDGCRILAVPNVKRFKYDRSEAQKMRAKALSMRKFDNPGAISLLKEYKAGGVTQEGLAKKYDCSINTIQKTLSRAKRLNGTSR